MSLGNGRHLGRRPALLALIALGALSVSATPAHAGTIEVTTTDDQHGAPGGCALREAIVAANTDADFGGCSDSGGDDVVKLGANRYVLARPGDDEEAAKRGDLDITDHLEIRGAGRDDTTIDGNGDRVGDRVINTLAPAEVEIRDLTIRGGKSGRFNGGGIDSQGPSLTIVNSAIRDNFAAGGAGGLVARGTVTIKNSLIEGNRTGSATAGGGVSLGAGGTMRITRSTIVGNKAAAFAGGVYANNGDVTISRSVVRDNEAIESTAGGIAQLAGSLTVSSTRIVGNRALESGGGVYGLASEITLIKSTVSGNRAQEGGGVFGHGPGNLDLERTTVSANRATADGGGVSVESTHPSELLNTTISGNSARNHGGGVYVNHADAEVTLNNVTVANNLADSDQAAGGSGGGVYRAAGVLYLYNSLLGDNSTRAGPPAEPDCDGGIAVVYSLIENDCPGLGSNNVVGEDPRLKDLADNGGRTHTHALRATSPALEVADPDPPGTTEFDCLPTDQRGKPRPGASRCDMGAFELQP